MPAASATRGVVKRSAPSRCRTRTPASRMSSRIRRERRCRGSLRGLKLVFGRVMRGLGTRIACANYCSYSMRRERRGKSSNGKDINVPEQGAELVTIQMTGELSITRVVNACVLLQLDEDAVLTDPYFAKHWFIRLRESIGLDVAALPRLTVILGGHGVFDHWQPASLVGYTHKSDTPVIVSTHAMRRAAVAAGFTRAKVLKWGATRRLSSRLEVEVAPAQAAAGMRVNNYVLQHRGLRVFIGTEARDLDP